MRHFSFLTSLLILLFSQQAFAIVTSPASVTTSSTFSTYNQIDLINQSGLSGGLESGLHDEDYFHSWMSDNGDTSPTLTFDLGGTFQITAAHIWQYNAVCCGLDRGVNGFNILYSSDNVSYTPLGSANLTMSAGGLIPAEVVQMAATARYIRFEVTSNHGDSSYTGLAEVAFDIGDAIQPPVQPPVEPVPGLSGWMLLLLSLLVLAIGARRYRLS